MVGLADRSREIPFAPAISIDSPTGRRSADQTSAKFRDRRLPRKLAGKRSCRHRKDLPRHFNAIAPLPGGRRRAMFYIYRWAPRLPTLAAARTEILDNPTIESTGPAERAILITAPPTPPRTGISADLLACKCPVLAIGYIASTFAALLETKALLASFRKKSPAARILIPAVALASSGNTASAFAALLGTKDFLALFRKIPSACVSIPPGGGGAVIALSFVKSECPRAVPNTVP